MLNLEITSPSTGELENGVDEENWGADNCTEPSDASNNQKMVCNPQRLTYSCPLTGIRCPCERYICRQKKFRYKQPPPRETWKPPLGTCPPNGTLCGETIYNTSYISRGDAKRESFKPHDILIGSNAKFDGKTTCNMAYMPWLNHKKRCSIRQPPSCLFAKGVVDHLTEHRVEFVPKPYSKRDSFKDEDVIKQKYDKPMEGQTTTMLAYRQHGDVKLQRCKRDMYADSFPKDCNDFTGVSVNKTSYVKWPNAEKLKIEWSGKADYQPPKISMNDLTVYKLAYKDSPLSIYKPAKAFKKDTCELITSGGPMAKCSVYREVYCPKQVQPNEIDCWNTATLKCGEGPMQKESLQKISYPPHENYKRCLVKKKQERLVLKEPADMLTIHKHDYTPKPYSKRDLKKQPPAYVPPPQSSKYETTTQCYFKVPPPRGPLCISKPKSSITLGGNWLTEKSTYRDSYLHFKLPEQADISDWTGESKPTVSKFEGITTYQANYRPPGVLVEDNSACCIIGCKCKYPLECSNINIVKQCIKPAIKC